MMKSDISIASNGIAGPKNEIYSADQSGTIFLSWNIHDKIVKTKRFKLEGGRNEVIDKAVFVALSMCLKYLKNDLRKDD
jgi:nicotinamide mononucleotide (NMN) deamidase PncC